MGIRYVELATNVLGMEPNEGTENIRAWAMKVISRYSEVPLSDKTKVEILQKGILRLEKGTVAYWMSSDELSDEARETLDKIKRLSEQKTYGAQ